MFELSGAAIKVGVAAAAELGTRFAATINGIRRHRTKARKVHGQLCLSSSKEAKTDGFVGWLPEK